ncbi:uncharacterized protein LOC144178086 [Haemaphysalis longicornis]
MELSRPSAERAVLEGLLALCCCFALLETSRGQFFSKTTNTIPRMGRRDAGYPDLEHTSLRRNQLLGFLRHEQARKPMLSLPEMRLLFGEDEERYLVQNRATNGCREGPCRMRGGGFIAGLPPVEGV